MQSGAQTVRFALKQWCKQAKWHCVLLLMHIITSHNNTLPTNTGVSICRHFETNMTQTKSLRVWIPDEWVFLVIVLDKVSLFWLINSSKLDFKICWILETLSEPLNVPHRLLCGSASAISGCRNDWVVDSAELSGTCVWAEICVWPVTAGWVLLSD